MISYRHHIVSLVAVFLALAAGIALGGGPLSDVGRDTRPASATTSLGKDVERTASYGDQFATAAASRLYDGGLRGRSVAVVTMPGADDDVVSALGEQVKAAGGTVAATYDVKTSLTHPSEKALVDTLGSQLMTQLGSGAVSPDAPTYERIGQLLGLAIAAGDASDEDGTQVRDSLSGADLLAGPDDADRATLVLFVLGDRVDPAILSGVAAGVAEKATGVVVAGSARSALGNGDLAGLRAESDADEVATVDGADTPLGQVTTVLALIRSLTAQGGAFGASGSDGAVPLK